MKFHADQAVLATAVALVAKAVGPNPPHPAMAGIRLDLEGDKLRLIAMDLATSISTTIAVDGRESGRALVPASRFATATQALPAGTVEVEIENTVDLRGGPAYFSLPTLVCGEFPDVLEPAEGVTVDGPAFWSALTQVAPAISKDRNRPTLQTLLVDPHDGMTSLMATDSYRMHLAEVNGAWDEEPALVPLSAVSLVRELGQASALRIARSASSITFSSGETYITSRLVADDPPRYRVLLERTNCIHHVEVESGVLLDAIRRLSSLAELAVGLPLSIRLTDGKMELVVRSDDGSRGEESLDIARTGPEYVTGTNPRHLAEAVRAAGSERIELWFDSNPLKALLVYSVPPSNFQAMVMTHAGFKNV